MNTYQWWVSFEGAGPGVSVRAGCEEEARILAQAHRINEGLEWRTVRSVEKVGEASSPFRRRHTNPLA